MSAGSEMQTARFPERRGESWQRIQQFNGPTTRFNLWRGCTKVSPGCAHCYAETQSKRNPTVLGMWGPNGTRVLAAPGNRSQPYSWDAACRREGKRQRVFSLSLGDWLEDWPGQMTTHEGKAAYVYLRDQHFDPRTTDGIVPADDFDPYTLDVARARLLKTVYDTPTLDWLLLTKRPENWEAKIFAAMRILERQPGGTVTDFYRWLCKWHTGTNPPANVWVGTSVENQAAAEARIPRLLEIPAAIRFLSVEPLLGAIDLHLGKSEGVPTKSEPFRERADLLHWVIVGGESGPGARGCDLEWIASLVDQCKAADVACFVKQLGRNPYLDYSPEPAAAIARKHGVGPLVAEFIRTSDKKGGDPAEWPEDLRIREFPKC